MVLRFEHDSEAEIYYYISTIGSPIVFITVIFLLAHSWYHYFRIFVSAHKDDDVAQGQSRITYIVFFITCFITLYICLIYTARSNLLLGQSPDSFTRWKCEFFQLTSYGLVAVQQLCIYFLFIFRIETSFEGTVYQYPSKLYRILYISLCVSFCIVIPVVFLSCYSGNRAEYVLYYFEDGTPNESDLYVWCDIMVDDHRYSLNDASDPRRIFFTVGTLYGIVSVLMYDVALLYLFTKRLYSLQIELMQQHIAEMLPDVGTMTMGMGTMYSNVGTMYSLKTTTITTGNGFRGNTINSMNGMNTMNRLTTMNAFNANINRTSHKLRVDDHQSHESHHDDHHHDDDHGHDAPKTTPTLSGSVSAPTTSAISVNSVSTASTMTMEHTVNTLKALKIQNLQMQNGVNLKGVRIQPISPSEEGENINPIHSTTATLAEDAIPEESHDADHDHDLNSDHMNIPRRTLRAQSVPMEDIRSIDSGPIQRTDSKSHSHRHSDPEIGIGFQKVANMVNLASSNLTRIGTAMSNLSIKQMEMEAKQKNESARRIMNLHKLIKQHTILVWVQIVSYIAWSVSVMVSSWMWIEVIWVLLINNVCLWLMFGISEKYWKCSTHWLCCALCYLDRNKDIGHRNRLCFC